MQNQRVTTKFPTNISSYLVVSEELRELAFSVQRIGSRHNANPETILIEKHEAADRLLRLADKLEAVA